MAAEVANNQPAAVPATEENVTEKKVDEVAADVKEEAKNADESAKAAENHADGAAPPAPAKVVPPKVTVHKADFEKDVIYLYQFSRTPFLPSISPYCLKVETWLRLAGLKYEVSQRLEISEREERWSAGEEARDRWRWRSSSGAHKSSCIRARTNTTVGPAACPHAHTHALAHSLAPQLIGSPRFSLYSSA